ncbi:MAG: hypothetical protein ACI8SJ_002012 [Shewanella sp.]|jgi:hypothetical protein
MSLKRLERLRPVLAATRINICMEAIDYLSAKPSIILSKNTKADET